MKMSGRWSVLKQQPNQSRLIQADNRVPFPVAILFYAQELMTMRGEISHVTIDGDINFLL
jgi:hypothetical protein